MILTVLALFIAVTLVAVVALRKTSGTTSPESGWVETAVEPDPSEERVEEVPRWQDLPAEEVTSFIEREQPRILDVRSPGETLFGVIPGATLIPIQELPYRVEELPREDRPTLIYCAHGIRSISACEYLGQLGYEKLYNLPGGIVTYREPLERPGSASRS